MSSTKALFQPKNKKIIIKNKNEKSPPPNNAMCMSVLQKYIAKYKQYKTCTVTPPLLKTRCVLLHGHVGAMLPSISTNFSGSAHALPAL